MSGRETEEIYRETYIDMYSVETHKTFILFTILRMYSIYRETEKNGKRTSRERERERER